MYKNFRNRLNSLTPEEKEELRKKSLESKPDMIQDNIKDNINSSIVNNQESLQIQQQNERESQEIEQRKQQQEKQIQEERLKQEQTKIVESKQKQQEKFRAEEIKEQERQEKELEKQNIAQQKEQERQKIKEEKLQAQQEKQQKLELEKQEKKNEEQKQFKPQIKLQNQNAFGIDNKLKKIKLTDLEKDKRDYLSLIDKKRELEGFPTNPKIVGGIKEVTMGNYKGSQTKLTGEEFNNMPSGMTNKDKEWIKYNTNHKIRQENNYMKFENYWDKVKDNYNVSDEVKELTRDKFNNLSSEDKLRLYKSFSEQERQKKELENTQEKNQIPIKSEEENLEKQEDKNTQQNKQAQDNKEEDSNFSIDDLKSKRQQIYDGVNNMTQEQYSRLSDEEINQISDTYKRLNDKINELEEKNKNTKEEANQNNKEEENKDIKSDENTTEDNKTDIKEENNGEEINQEENKQLNEEEDIQKDNNLELDNKIEELTQEFGVETSIENGKLKIGLKNEKQEELVLNLYDEDGNLKDKNDLDMEISKHFSKTIASNNNTGLGKNKEQETSSSILSKLGQYLFPKAHAPYNESIKEEKPYKDNPNYSNYNETLKYYQDKGINYDFSINTDSEFYNEDNALIKQENIINILGNKDLLHEVNLYPNGEEFKKDEKGNFLRDDNGNKIKNTPLTMYQVWEDGDTGGGQYNNDSIIKRDNKGQCTYLVAKFLKDALPYEDYPFDNIKDKRFKLFDSALSAGNLISILGNKKDKENNNIFEISSHPSIGSIYANPNEPLTYGAGHIAIVTDVKLIKKGEIEEENEYEITLLEQNSTIEKNGVQYEPLSNIGGGEYGVKKHNEFDYTMAIGQRTTKVKGKSGIGFISKNN